LPMSSFMPGDYTGEYLRRERGWQYSTYARSSGLWRSELALGATPRRQLPAHQYRQHDRREEQRRHVAPQVPDLTGVGHRVDRHDSPVHDTRPDSEPDDAQVAGRVSRGEEEEHTERGVDAPNHLQIGRLLWRPGP